MIKIHVERVLKKSPEAVFSHLVDHAKYKEFRGITDAALLEEGHAEKNGLGALRMIKAGAVTFYERIVRFEPPYVMGYLIEKARPLPLVHDLGEVTLVPFEGGTKVTWISHFKPAIPLMGLFLGSKLQKSGSAAFASLLKQIDAL